MKNTPDLAVPSTAEKAFLLWLLTNFFGAVSMFLGLLISETPHQAVSTSCLIGAFAAVGSLVVIPLALPAFRYLLAIDSRAYRLLAATGVITAFFLFPAVGLSFYLGALDEVIKSNGWVYLPTALLVAMLVYRRSLLRPKPATMTSVQH